MVKNIKGNLLSRKQVLRNLWIQKNIVDFPSYPSPPILIAPSLSREASLRTAPFPVLGTSSEEKKAGPSDAEEERFGLSQCYHIKYFIDGMDFTNI